MFCLLQVYVVKDCDTVAAFTQLMPTLTHLSVGGRAFDNTAARLVAQLTTLQALEWSYSMITSSALRRLTSLTNLDSLEIRDSPLVGVTNCTGLSGMNGLELSTSGEVCWGSGQTGSLLLLPWCCKISLLCQR